MIRIPPPRSPLWFALGAGIGVAATAIFILFYAVIFNLDVSNVNIGGILLLFVGLCQVSALAGFFKLKLLAGLSFLGLFAGITMLLSVVKIGRAHV